MSAIDDIIAAGKQPTKATWDAFFSWLKNLSMDDLVLSDNTINDVSTSKHGHCPKLDGNPNHFLRSDGAQAAPPGSGGVGGATGAVDGAIIVADGTAGDTLKGSGTTLAEISAAISGRAPASHSHVEGDVTGLTDALAVKVVGPALVTDGHIAVFDGTTGKLLKDGGAPGGGASLWTALGTPTYTTGSNTFTLTGDQTALLPAGTWLKYVNNGHTLWGQVVSATYSSVTTIVIRGQPIDANLTAVYYGSPAVGDTYVIPLPGYWDAATVTAYIASVLGQGIPWEGPPAYIVGFTFSNGTADSSSDAYINASINGVKISTSNSNKGLEITSTSTFSTDVDLASASNTNLILLPGQVIDAAVTAGTGLNAFNGMLTILYVKVS